MKRFFFTLILLVFGICFLVACGKMSDDGGDSAELGGGEEITTKNWCKAQGDTLTVILNEKPNNDNFIGKQYEGKKIIRFNGGYVNSMEREDWNKLNKFAKFKLFKKIKIDVVSRIADYAFYDIEFDEYAIMLINQDGIMKNVYLGKNFVKSLFTLVVFPYNIKNLENLDFDGKPFQYIFAWRFREISWFYKFCTKSVGLSEEYNDNKIDWLGRKGIMGKWKFVRYVDYYGQHTAPVGTYANIITFGEDTVSLDGNTTINYRWNNDMNCFQYSFVNGEYDNNRIIYDFSMNFLSIKVLAVRSDWTYTFAVREYERVQ